MKMYLDFNDELFDAAEKLARTMTLQSDGKALKELSDIEKHLRKRQGCVSEYMLDSRIRCEHPIIEQIEILDNQFAHEITPDMYVQTTADNVMRSRLKVDRRGILIEVLLKHGRIRKPEEVYR